MQDTGSSALLEHGYWRHIMDQGASAAFEHLSRRMVETSVLSSPPIRDLARYWDLYLGRHDDVIRQRLAGLGITEPDLAFVIFVRRCLESWHARYGLHEDIDPRVERTAFELYPRRMDTQLRCEICGYADAVSSVRTSMDKYPRWLCAP